MVFILVAPEAGAVRVATRAANAVAADAELFTGTAVTTGTRRGIDPRFHTMLAVRPAWWMGAARRRSRDLLAAVTVDARALRVARRAEPGVGPCFPGVAGGEARSMKPGEANVTKGQFPRQRGDRSLAVARGALPVGVAARAKVPLARRAHSMLSYKIPVVDQVVVRSRSLGRQIDVAAAAVPPCPLIAMFVASEAGRHLRQDRVGTSLDHLGMTADTISTSGDHVARVVEAQLSACELRRLPHVGLSVAASARPLVMGLLVAAAADGVRREMERPSVPSGRYVGVALDAVDALANVRAVFERVRWPIPAQSEHAGAGCQSDRQDHDEGEMRPHREAVGRPWAGGLGVVMSRAHDRRTRASAS